MSEEVKTFFKILGVIILIGALGGILYNFYSGVNNYLSSDEYQNQLQQQVIVEQQRIEEQSNCEHEWVVVSDLDRNWNVYKIYSRCVKCGKEVR